MNTTTRLMANQTDEQLVARYQSHTTPQHERDATLAELFRRHAAIMNHIAGRFCQTYHVSASQRDFFQEAHLAAEMAYRAYNLNNKTRASVTTYMNTYVFRELQNYVDEQCSTFRLHPHLVGIRNWLLGKMDDQPARLAKFETKFGLDTEDKREAFRRKYGILIASMISTDTLIPGTNQHADYYNMPSRHVTDRTAEARILIENFEKRLAPDELRVWRLYHYYDYTRPQICELLGIDAAAVKRHIRNSGLQATRYRAEIEGYLANHVFGRTESRPLSAA